MRKVELFSFPISPSHTVFLLPQTQNGVLLSLSFIGVALSVSIRYICEMVNIHVTINTEGDEIEETTADRNEVQIRQLNHTETEEPCDVPSHLTDLLERSKKHLSKEQNFQLTK
jgi:thiamine biosynthesis lipoprotein ApbE